MEIEILEGNVGILGWQRHKYNTIQLLNSFDVYLYEFFGEP